MHPKIYHATEHDINHGLIDPDAIHVIQKLRDAGFSAYLVGGSVRDLLIKKSPKDYDISTSARPEQIKHLFGRNCLLIGRRFRLAHIRYGHKILELSTFRSGENESDLILQDNVWGTEEEDVRRRDFTINGLFYDPSTHTVIDYVGGWEDIHKGILRSIGDANIRFKQDPVRMIRLLKFRARFGFDIDPDARKALVNCRSEITKSSAARLLEEILRMLESGASASFFNLMNEAGLLELLFSSLAHFLKGKQGKEIYLLLTSADKMNRKNLKSPLDRSVLTACLLYPIICQEIQTQFLDKDRTPHAGDITLLAATVTKDVLTSSFTHFPRRISSTTAFLLATQFRLTPISPKKHHRPKVIRHKEFKLALDFLEIRACVDKKLVETYNTWKQIYKQQERHGEHKAHHPAPFPRG